MDGMGYHDAGGRTGALGGPQAVVSYSVKLMSRSSCALSRLSLGVLLDSPGVDQWRGPSPHSAF